LSVVAAAWLEIGKVADVAIEKLGWCVDWLSSAILVDTLKKWK